MKIVLASEIIDQFRLEILIQLQNVCDIPLSDTRKHTLEIFWVSPVWMNAINGIKKISFCDDRKKNEVAFIVADLYKTNDLKRS